MKNIELLAPAKNLESAMAAINFGADAVYVGPEQFGARRAAGNSLSDIEKMVHYAHKFHSKVFATVNTVLFDDELNEAQRLIHRLSDIGVDAVIIQDMGILEMDLPPVPLHLSTQAHNYTMEQLQFVDQLGFQRIVLAREMSLNQIKSVSTSIQSELEYFVHGALCVCFSGQCYMSAVQGGRSGNRGECAQPCRKFYDLIDGTGRCISRNQHLLSIKDLNLTDQIASLIDAGITSLKIEGRLKDISYVKNIVGHYRQTLDRILDGQDGVAAASSGHVVFDFQPDPDATFNRGYSDYFVKGAARDSIHTFDTPKSKGKLLGKVTEVSDRSFLLDTKTPVNNGDGLIFIDTSGHLKGIKVNRSEGMAVFPLDMAGIYVGATVYRNSDVQFEKQLASSKTKRVIFVDMMLADSDSGFLLQMTDEDGISVEIDVGFEKELANSPDQLYQNIEKQLRKLGNTIFAARDISIRLSKPWFIPVKLLNDMRRRGADLLEEKRVVQHPFVRIQIDKNTVPYPRPQVGMEGNVTNRLAKQFYERHGAEVIRYGVEVDPDTTMHTPLMTTKMCLKYEMEMCPKFYPDCKGMKEPLYILDGDKRYRLGFDCSECVMKLFLV